MDVRALKAAPCLRSLNVATINAARACGSRWLAAATFSNASIFSSSMRNVNDAFFIEFRIMMKKELVLSIKKKKEDGTRSLTIN